MQIYKKVLKKRNYFNINIHLVQKNTLKFVKFDFFMYICNMKQKRYQYWNRDGKNWSEWFDYDGEEFPYQFEESSKNRRLLNEYRNI